MLTRRVFLQRVLVLGTLATAVAEPALASRADAVAKKALQESSESKLEELYSQAQELSAEARRGASKPAQDLARCLEKLVSSRLNLARLKNDPETAAQVPAYQKKVEEAWKSYQGARAKVH